MGGMTRVSETKTNYKTCYINSDGPEEPVVDDCAFVIGDGSGGSEHKISDTLTGQECMRECYARGGYNGATINSNGSGGCWCESGMTTVISSATSYMTCYIAEMVADQCEERSLGSEGCYIHNDRDACLTSIDPRENKIWFNHPCVWNADTFQVNGNKCEPRNWAELYAVGESYDDCLEIRSGVSAAIGQETLEQNILVRPIQNLHLLFAIIGVISTIYFLCNGMYKKLSKAIEYQTINEGAEDEI